MRTARIVAVALVVAAAVAVGAALAGTHAGRALQGNVQTVNACVHNGNSQLRVVTDSSLCGGDNVVSWNATVGSQLSGQVGDVFTTRDDVNDVRIAPDTRVRLARLALPPGSYSISAKVVVAENEAHAVDFAVACTLTLPDTNVGDEALTEDVGQFTTQTLPLQLVVTLAQPSAVSLDCFNESGQLDEAGFDVFAREAALTALVVGKVNNQP